MENDWNFPDSRIRKNRKVAKYEKAFQEAYKIENTLQVPFPNEDIVDASEFPKNIKEHFWIRSDTIESGTPWMAVGELTDKNYFYYRADKEKNEAELYVTPNYRSLIEFGLRDRYKIEYKDGGDKPSFLEELPRYILMERPYMPYISGTEDPEDAKLTEWDIRLREGKLLCFACNKEFLFRAPGEYLCLPCNLINQDALKKAAEIELQRQKARAAAAAVPKA